MKKNIDDMCVMHHLESNSTCHFIYFHAFYKWNFTINMANNFSIFCFLGVFEGIVSTHGALAYKSKFQMSKKKLNLQMVNCCNLG
jgi:hypothetical protein